MKRAEDGLPIVGTASKELGVRLPPDENADIEVGEDLNVKLNGKGMSVASDWRFLLPHLIPKRFKPMWEGAAGSNALEIYAHGEGAFEEGQIDAHLSLALKPGTTQHGNVVPIQLASIESFLNHLAETREQWIAINTNG